MSDNDELPDDLAAIAADEIFTFSCGPEQPCFNRCCAQLALPLTPYDCLRLALNLQLACAEVLRLFASPVSDTETGLPAFMLRMIESPDSPCPFVTPGGCSVYEDRPGACRAYPLGRGARVSADGVKERFFIIREEHCAGFGAGSTCTAAQWFAEPQLRRYNHFNDRYMRLLSLVRASGQPIAAKLAGMARLCLWQNDSFGDFLQKMKIPAQIAWDGPKEKLAHNDLAGAEARLEFGLSWLELLIFGQAPDMRRA